MRQLAYPYSQIQGKKTGEYTLCFFSNEVAPEAPVELHTSPYILFNIMILLIYFYNFDS